MSETLEAIITWTVIFAVISGYIFFKAYTKVKKNLREYKRKECNKGLPDEKIIKKEIFNEATYPISLVVIGFLFFLGMATFTKSCLKRRPQPKIENPYEGSKEQQEDIDFANELIKEDINKYK